MSTPPQAPAAPLPSSGAPRPAPGDRLTRWGFVGCGDMADTFANAVRGTPGHELIAAAARDGDRAEAFAHAHGATRSYEGYEPLYADPDVDVVYVATTHPYHHGPALAAARAGKAILVEKPFMLNADQAREVFAAAAEAGTFAMEAMWLRTQPLVRTVQNLVAQGAIGDLVSVHAEFGVCLEFDPTSRMFDITNGGGALLDLGVYAASFCWLFLGEPAEVQVLGSLAPTGADRAVTMQWGYDTGATASLFTSTHASGPHRATLLGRDGWIEITPPAWQSPQRAVLHVERDDDRVLHAPSRGYAHQVEEVGRCLAEGLTESPLMPQADTVAVLEILDAARSELGVRYPQEG